MEVVNKKEFIRRDKALHFALVLLSSIEDREQFIIEVKKSVGIEIDNVEYQKMLNTLTDMYLEKRRKRSDH